MDQLYYNGTFLTMRCGSAEEELAQHTEAVLVRDGIIRAVGTMEEVTAAMDASVSADAFTTADAAMATADIPVAVGASATEGTPATSDISAASGASLVRIDLKGRCLMPAFIDPHSHIVMNGQMSMCASLGDCESYQDIIDTLGAFLQEKKIGPDGIVFGFGYDHNFLKEGGQPDKRVLDQVSTEIPIFILHVSAHLACANSKALELAGITADTPDPSGGVIGRLEDGREPSGYLEEAGMMAVQQAVARRMQAGYDFSSLVSGMQQAYIENGITTAQDGASGANEVKTLIAAADMGRLKIDVVSYPLMPNGGVALLHDNQERVRCYKNRLKIGGYKLVLDGSPQGRSAWMTQPYLGGDPEYCGYPWMADEEVRKYAKLAVEEGQQLLTHCNGDAAGDQLLEAYERALRETGSRQELRPVMIHCQTARNDQLDRMARLHMVASIFVGHVYYWGDVHMRNFGIQRGHHISPVKDAMDRGLVVNFHQDTPVTAPNMLHSIWAAVNRISRGGQRIGPDQAVPVYDALKAATINGAYQYFEEDTKGSIEPGKRADLIILDQSPLNVDPLAIKDIRVVETIKDGETIYRL